MTPGLFAVTAWRLGMPVRIQDGRYLAPCQCGCRTTSMLGTRAADATNNLLLIAVARGYGGEA